MESIWWIFVDSRGLIVVNDTPLGIQRDGVVALVEEGGSFEKRRRWRGNYFGILYLCLQLMDSGLQGAHISDGWCFLIVASRRASGASGATRDSSIAFAFSTTASRANGPLMSHHGENVIPSDYPGLQNICGGKLTKTKVTGREAEVELGQKGKSGVWINRSLRRPTVLYDKFPLKHRGKGKAESDFFHF